MLQASTAHIPESPRTALYDRMAVLWEQHMEWTYATVMAFATNQPDLTPTLTRLLQNQTDIGNAVVPYYGQAAGNELSTLLHAHIMGYVPLLENAKAGKTAAADKDFAAILANGRQIGAFLGKANPNWSAAQMSQMMTVHNEQTLAYATDILEGNWTQAITAYDTAEAHMDQMADMLSQGIIDQFPGKFRK
ncbi:MAG: glycosyltransferase [Acidimicrobiales bacterium]